MILSHTPLKKLLPKYNDKFVLVSGMLEAVDVCVDYGFEKAMHVEEVLALIPEVSRFARASLPESTLIRRKADVLKRFEISQDELISQL